MRSVYLIDSNSLIKLKHYPPEVFESLWERIEALISDGRLLAPREVYREVARGDDEIERWAKQHRTMFVELDPDQAAALREVQKRFPNLHDAQKTGPDADPVLVALCLARSRSDGRTRYYVITEEKLKGPGSTRIPNVCHALGLKAIPLLEMFRLEGFRF